MVVSVVCSRAGARAPGHQLEIAPRALPRAPLLALEFSALAPARSPQLASAARHSPGLSPVQRSRPRRRRWCHRSRRGSSRGLRRRRRVGVRRRRRQRAGRRRTTGADIASEAPADGAASVSERIARVEQHLAGTNARDWDTWQALSAASSDYHLELRQAFGQSEWLAIRLHTTGTMTGPLTLSDGTSVPSTGQPNQQDWAALVRFQGDRSAEFHEFCDQFLLMVQLGLAAP